MERKVNWQLLGFDILRIIVAIIVFAAVFNVRLTWERAEWWIILAGVVAMWVIGKLDDRPLS